MTKTNNAKGRHWTFVVYPESAPENFIEELQELNLDGFISPLHNKDKNPDHTVKKAHYHVILMWDGPTTYNNAKTIVDKFNGVLDPTPVQSLAGAVRYLTHMDNPEKYQYNKKEVITLGSANYFETIQKTQLASVSLRDIFEFCKEHKVYAFNQLVDYACRYNEEWFQVLTKQNTYVVTQYLKSLHWSQQNEQKDFINKSTNKWFLDMLEAVELPDGTLVSKDGEVLNQKKKTKKSEDK